MPVTYPVDILADFPAWATDFDLLHRQELSRTAGGFTIAKDMGTPLWRATYQTRVMRPSELDKWRAKLSTLEGSVQFFWGRPSRCYPLAYPNGTGMGDVPAVKIASVNGNNKSVRLSGLPAGYKASIGDYMQIKNTLYMVVDIAGLDIEVRPHLAPGIAVNDPVKVVRPSVQMIVVPGSLSSTADAVTGRGSISFQAIESRQA